MAAVPAPHTWIAGDDATSTALQTLTDALLFLLGSVTSGGARRAVVELQQAVAQAALVTGTWTDVVFGAETVDYDNGHSTTTNTARYTAQTAGWYQFSGGVAFAANATGRRGTRWAINGAAVDASEVMIPATAAGACTVAARTVKLYLNAGDYVTLQGYQESGGGLATLASGTAECSMSGEWRSN